MEIFLVCIMIGWLGFRLIKANTIRGLETVRAYAYLEAAKNGQSREACAEISDYDFMVTGASTPPSGARYSCKADQRRRDWPAGMKW